GHDIVIDHTDSDILAAGRLFIFERNRLWVVREKCNQLFQPRLTIDCARQTLCALIRQPGLDHVPVSKNEAVARMKARADEWILSDLTVAFRSQFRLVGAILDCASAFAALRFGHPQWTAGSRFDERV